SNAGDAAPAGEPASAPSAASASATPSVTPTPASAEGSSGTVASSYAVGNGAGGDDTTTVVMPTVATGVAVQWVDPAAPWISQVGGNPSGTVLEPALVATVELLFDDTKLDLRDAQQFEGVYFPLGTTADPASIQAVDHDARDFRAEPPPAALYRIPEVKLSDKAYFTKAQKDLVDHLFRTQTVDILLNSELKLVGRPGESAEEFAARCEAAADAGADAESAKVASRIQAKMERVKGALATAEDRVAQAEQAQSSRRNDELLSGAGDLLGALFGGRKSARSLASKVGTAGRRRGRSSEAAQRVATANNRVEEKTAELADLADELQDAIADIADAWDTKAEAVETVQVPLEKADIKVSQMSLVWIPV
ncbi:MAG: hypothetical protein WBF71_10715, partial [Microthrixaceae bacterium]